MLTLLLSAGNFAIGMGAFVVIGLLNPMGEAFTLTTSEAGWILTVYAIAYALGSPVAVALTGRWARRTVLLFGLMLFAVGA
ncbi:MAG: MFS transporter, partial [Pseudomonadota bacterium]